MGRRYVELLAQLPEAKVTAVCDLRADLASEIAAAHGALPFTEVEALLQTAEVDALFVCTPEDCHVEPGLRALAAGKALLIEKPIAHTLVAANQIAEAARASGAVFMVGHLLRFEPRWVAAKRAVAAGDIGAITSIATRRVGNILDQTVLGGRTTIPLYYGVHDLDILRWFVGAEVETIYAARRAGVLHKAGYNIDDLYCAVLTFANGVLATAELGWHVPATAVEAPTAGLTIVGSEGWLRIEQKDAGLEYWTSQPGRTIHPTFDVFFWSDAHGVPGGALANELRHFLACVRGDAQPIISLEDAVEALRLSLAMEASAQAGRVIALAEFG
jgi:predicted dehydrogenase